MVNQTNTVQAEKQEMMGMERLGLRISSMINHPVAQSQRWVVIHRLDTDGDMEWAELMSVLSETDNLDMTGKDDGTILLEWEALSDDDRPIDLEELEVIDEPAPF